MALTRPDTAGGALLAGDCVPVMAGMAPCSVDSIVTDPPYALAFMGKAWDAHPNPRAFHSWCAEWGTEALRVARPGAYLLAFGGTRTHHRLVCGLEDAGWIIRDELDWIYASGFPKGKANLKPAHEPIVLARKPGPLRPLAIDECRIGLVSEERVMRDFSKQNATPGIANPQGDKTISEGVWENTAGRWPSNVLLSDPELFDEPNPYVVGSGATSTDLPHTRHNRVPTGSSGIYGEFEPTPTEGYGDSGGYARFFIVPKADRADREPVLRGTLELGPPPASARSKPAEGRQNPLGNPRENAHPTVKPTDLMRHLVRLVTPQGGTVLDPFLGSGTTAIAAELEGFPWIGIEKEPEYLAITRARLNGTQRGLGL